MLDVTDDILNFSLFLDQSWQAAQLFFNKDELNGNCEDWLQANWEILVESKICYPLQFLQLYGNGADCYGEYSRVTYYDKLPTHKIVGQLSCLNTYDFYSNKNIYDLKDYTFHSFLNIVNGEVIYQQPFNYVEFEHDILDTKIWISKNNIRYFKSTI